MAHELNVALLSGYSGTSVQARLFVAGGMVAEVEMTEVGSESVFSNAGDMPTLPAGRYLVKYCDPSGNYLAQCVLDWSGSAVAQNVSHINWLPANPAATLVTTSQLDQQVRILSFRRLANFPITAAGSVVVEELLTSWRQRLVIIAGLWLLLAAAMWRSKPPLIDRPRLSRCTP